MENNRTSSCGPVRRWLYRDPARGKIAGVCAGIGEHLGVDPFLVRLGVVASLFVFGPFTIVAYIVAVLALPVRDGKDDAKERFWETANMCLDQVRAQVDKHARSRRHGKRTPPPWASDDDPAGPPRKPENLDEMRNRLREIDKRIVTMEAYVASREFGLSQAIRDLEK